jgi:uncharacterized protein
MDLTAVWLAVLALGAAIINGAVGYGFSSTVTPIAILWYSNKVLNPALVIVEVVVNVALLTRERRYLRSTWPRARPVVATLFPGVILGTVGLAYLAVNDVKLIVYLVLLPLVVVQLAGISRPFRNERRGGAVVGPFIGFLYSLTTISGPPLALFLRNQGISKHEFRCTIAQIRVAESTLTLGTYLAFDSLFSSQLVTLPALSLIPFLLVPVLVGVPLGTLMLTRISPQVFLRVVMTVDGLIVSYGLSRVFVSLGWLSVSASYLFLALAFLGVGAMAAISMGRLRGAESAGTAPRPSTADGGTAPPGPTLARLDRRP